MLGKSFNTLFSSKKGVILLSFFVFIISNLVVSQINIRFDFSKDKLFTLSSSSVEIAKQVDDLLVINFIASSTNVPKQISPLRDRVIGLLEEYERVNPKIEVKILDPDKDSEAVKLAEENGLPPLQFSELQSGKFAISKAYFGIVLKYLDKTEVIPQAFQLESLEYNLTTAIYRMITKELPKVAIVGQQQPFLNQNSQISIFDRTLRSQFSVVYPELSALKEEKPKALILIDDGEKKYSSDEAKLLKEFVDSKNNLIAFVDGVWVSDNLTSQEAEHGLFDFFASYGLNLKKNLVLSFSSELVNFGGNGTSLILPYPFWIRTNYFNQEKPYFSNINWLTYPWVSEIELSGKDVSYLVKTVPESWVQEGEFKLFPDTIEKPAENDLKQRVITAMAEPKDKGKIILFSSRRFILDRFLSRNDNLSFVLQLLVSLTNPKLASIGIKNASIYILPNFDYPLSELIRYGLIFGLPGLFLLYGIYRVIRRR